MLRFIFALRTGSATDALCKPYLFVRVVQTIVRNRSHVNNGGDRRRAQPSANKLRNASTASASARRRPLADATFIRANRSFQTALLLKRAETFRRGRAARDLVQQHAVRDLASDRAMRSSA